MCRLIKFLDDGLTIVLQWAFRDDETTEYKIGLGFFPLQYIYLLSLHFQVLVGEGKHSRAVLYKVDVVISITIRHNFEILLNDFRSTLAKDSEGSAPCCSILDVYDR